MIHANEAKDDERQRLIGIAEQTDRVTGLTPPIRKATTGSGAGSLKRESVLKTTLSYLSAAVSKNRAKSAIVVNIMYSFPVLVVDGNQPIKCFRFFLT